MNINIINKLKTYVNFVLLINRLPSLKQKIHRLLLPIETTRYTEFTYIIKYLEKNKIKPDNVLDVSSPYMLAYFLAKKGAKVIKTDINSGEERYIKKNKNLFFQKENALHLSFNNDNFDLTYSISVIEHIYEDYLKAIDEMIRVTQKGGLIYLTFPVSDKHQEVWCDDDIYSDQAKKDSKIFFCYRYDKADVDKILKHINTKAVILSYDIYWEIKNGSYNITMSYLKKFLFNKYFSFMKDILVHSFSDLFLFRGKASDFSNAKDFGNAHIIIKKI